MKNIEITELKREQILIVVAVVLLLIAAQLFMMKGVNGGVAELSSASQEAQVLKATVAARSNAVIQYKSTVKIDGKELPTAIESQNKFYSVLLNLLSTQGFGETNVTKADEKEGVVSFSVSGEANYNELLRLLASFRQGAYLMRISQLSLEGLRENNVKYSFTVAAKIGGALKRGGGGEMRSISLKELFRQMRLNEAARSPEERKKEYIFVLLLFVFFAAAVFTMRNFIAMNGITADGEDLSSQQMPRGNQALESAKALNAKYEAFRKMREQSPELVALSDAIGRSPVAAVVPSPSLAADTSVPEFVPTVTIKGLVVLGGSTICTLDIDGEESGQIFKPGMTFGGGKGKILSIDSKGVSWRWANKNHRTDL